VADDIDIMLGASPIRNCLANIPSPGDSSI
jgi:hypothetical protein